MMEVEQDFSDLLESFNAHDVDYMIVGAYALAFHGVPRYTEALDILVRADKENAEHIIRALDDFGFGSLGLTAEDFASPGKVIQLGVAPVRADILTSITGVSWAAAKRGREEGTYGNVPVYYIGKEQFIVNKRALGRALGREKDLADLEALGEE